MKRLNLEALGFKSFFCKFMLISVNIGNNKFLSVVCNRKSDNIVFRLNLLTACRNLEENSAVFI